MCFISSWITGSSGAKTATCSAIVKLAVGDSVRVTGDSSDQAVLQAGMAGFLGHMIARN